MTFCFNCGAERLPAHKFCGHCGASLSAAADVAPARPSRRHLEAVARELETGLGEALHQGVLAQAPPTPEVEPRPSSQRRPIRPWYKAWLWAARLGVLQFAISHPSLGAAPGLLPIAVLAFGTAVVVLGVVSAAIATRRSDHLRYREVKRLFDDEKRTSTIRDACFAIGLLLTGNALYMAKAFHSSGPFVGLVEAAVWLVLGCFPRFGLRHSGKLASLALVGCFGAYEMAAGQFSLTTLLYAALFASLLRIWLERRFVRKLIKAHGLEGVENELWRQTLRLSPAW